MIKEFDPSTAERGREVTLEVYEDFLFYKKSKCFLLNVSK
jgi:hypothetical protein|nr:MAG TPA: hypothetical protein [Caudoviricetes sp.]